MNPEVNQILNEAVDYGLNQLDTLYEAHPFHYNCPVCQASLAEEASYNAMPHRNGILLFLTCSKCEKRLTDGILRNDRMLWGKAFKNLTMTGHLVFNLQRFRDVFLDAFYQRFALEPGENGVCH